MFYGFVYLSMSLFVSFQNRSSHLDSLSKAAHFDFLNPSERSTSLTELRSSNGSVNDDTPLATEHIFSTKCDLWPLFVRMTSFFFIESRYYLQYWVLSSLSTCHFVSDMGYTCRILQYNLSPFCGLWLHCFMSAALTTY